MALQREWCALSRDEASEPVEEVTGNLVRIVARGGSYLLGIGPDATGHMPDSVRDSLERIGTWMTACGEGVYGTRVPVDAPRIAPLDESSGRIEVPASPTQGAVGLRIELA